MTNLAKTTNQTNLIEKWDIDRDGNDVIYHYITPDLSYSDEPFAIRITADELEQFIADNELNEFQTDVDDFKSYDAWDYLMDNWEEVKDQYWDEFLQPKLEMSYKEASNYLEVYAKQHTAPLSKEQVKAVLNHVKHVFGVEIRRAA
ncbi:hypothetical protein [Pedobacter faecalis]|uniref:hypothetical protein n=1 Tax=Pedobacter faecalis TaxID=3041495 RepID=UPI00254F5DF1|nr:hypothetical protein [Pedobacter sp. ELA7]